jgi:hypothetical protein
VSQRAFAQAEACGAQRWRDGAMRFRPPERRIDPRRHDVRRIDVAHARAFVARHHYAGSLPAAQLCVGLFAKASAVTIEQLVGVAVFSVPMNDHVVPRWCAGVGAREGCELGRLCLLDEVPFNGESFFIARAFRLARDIKGVRGVVAYCDPVERRDVDGALVKRGHLGGIYRATSARFGGRSAARTLQLLPDGRVASERSLSKLRRGERGADGVLAALMRSGAPRRVAGEDGEAYLRRLKTQGFLRAIAHPGNLVFSWQWPAAQLRHACDAK